MLGPTIALLAALLGPAAASASPVDGVAGPKQVRVASCESRVAPARLATVDPATVLRRDLERAIDAIDWQREGVHRPVEVMAVLAEADSRSGRGMTHASMTVRAVVREPNGKLLAIVSGAARGEDREGSRADLERDVLLVAAQKASSSLPEAIRRARGDAAR